MQNNKKLFTLALRANNMFGFSKMFAKQDNVLSLVIYAKSVNNQLLKASFNNCRYNQANQFAFSTTQNKGQAQKKGPLKPEQIPQQNLEVVATQQNVGQENVQVFHTKGTLSILDKVPGVKHQQSGQLYVLMFTCTKCQTKSIRSFTKNAYHKGVVMVRCNGCDNLHLVADNLGWFQDEPTNIEKLHQGKVQRVHDQGAINMFLKKAFQQQPILFHDLPHQKNKSKTQTQVITEQTSQQKPKQ